MEKINRKYKKGLMVGRFQPLHKGHVYLINKGLEECDVLQVFLGSIQEKRTNRNIFCFTERLEMISNCFKKEISEKRIILKGLRDINNFANWSKYVLGSAHKDTEIYYAGSEEDALPFKKYPVRGFEDIKIKVIKLPETKSGTEIREYLINKNISWKKYIPPENWKIIQRINYESLVSKDMDI